MPLCSKALVVENYINTPKNGDPISGPRRAINFVSCLFQRANSISSSEACSNLYLEADEYRNFIEFIRLDTEEVNAAFEKMRIKTQQVAASGSLIRIPLVTVNGDIDYNAFNDLVQEVCAKYQVSNDDYVPSYFFISFREFKKQVSVLRYLSRSCMKH